MKNVRAQDIAEAIAVAKEIKGWRQDLYEEYNASPEVSLRRQDLHESYVKMCADVCWEAILVLSDYE